MKTRWTRWRLWWRQRSLLGAHHHLLSHNRWGANYATFTYLGQLIGPQVEAHYSGKQLKAVQGWLATESIDELVTDLSIVQRTVDKADYVDERLIYIHHRLTSLHQYLALMSGPALSPQEAWKLFHEAALAVTWALDSMLLDEAAENDRGYYLRRYGSVLKETYQVYGLFASLTDLTLPPLPSAE